MGTTWTRSSSRPASRYMRRTNRLGTQTSSTSSLQRPEPLGRGCAPNSQGWMTARRPERGGRRSGGHWWRTSTSAAWGSGVSSGAPARSRRWTRVEAGGDLVVDVRQARVQSVVALPGDGGRGGRQRRARGALAGVVGLELVDVRGERARRLDPGLKALEQAGLAGQAIELAREVAGVEAVEEQAVDARRARPRPGRRGAGRRAARARPGTRPPSAARSPTTARA